MGRMMEGVEPDAYDGVAKHYDLFTRPALVGVRRKVVEMAGLKEDDSVLEVACGTGEQALLYAREGARVSGLDISNAMLRIAAKKMRQRQGSLEPLLGDATDIHYEDDLFDHSSISLALHEMSPSVRNRVISEMIRVTKPEGSIIITDYTLSGMPGLGSYFFRMAIKACERIAGGDHHRNYIDFMGRGGLHYLIEENGFRILEEQRTFGGNLGILKLRYE